MQKFVRLLIFAAVASILISKSASAQDGDWKDMKCLTGEQQVQLINLSNELQEKFKLNLLLDEFREASQTVRSLRPKASSCRSRLDNPLQVVGAIADGCIQAVDEFNGALRDYNRAESMLADVQKIIIGNLNLARMRYPTCRQ